jgi:2-polyprenyl-3-methyl-5-hydroxy-6-metoxy-1,4-benzoquinol methylase
VRKIPEPMLRRMADELSHEDRDEMAIPSYLHRNPALRWMAWRRVTVIADRLAKSVQRGNNRDTAIMDFGCGTGVLLEECSRNADRVYGVDLVLDSARLLQREWNLDRVTLMTPPEAAAQVAPGSIDVIVAAEVLEHVEPLEPALAQFATWLKPGGRLLVSLPTENRLYKLGRRLAGFSGHYHHANAASIDPVITRAGFQRHRIEKIPFGGPLSIYWVIDYARA